MAGLVLRVLTVAFGMDAAWHVLPAVVADGDPSWSGAGWRVSAHVSLILSSLPERASAFAEQSCVHTKWINELRLIKASLQFLCR